MKNHELVMSPKSTASWGTDEYAYHNLDISELPNYTDIYDVLDDYNGKSNTEVMLAAYANTSAMNAARYCYNKAQRDSLDWYLPAMGELYEVYSIRFWISERFQMAGYYQIHDAAIWSSTEYDDDHAWYLDGSDYFWGRDYTYKTHVLSVSCFLDISGW